MPLFHLLDTTGVPNLDRLLRGMIGTFEEAFPGRVVGYYLVGSQADGSAVGLSDVDLRVVFKEAFDGDAELQRFLRVREYLRLISLVDIDCPPLDEHRLQYDDYWLHETLSIKYASRHLFGADIREKLRDPSLEAYLGNLAHALSIFMSRLHRQDSIKYPLQYPDPLGEFYGYEMLDSTQGSSSLKMMVHVAGFLASWKLGHEARQMVVKKSDWLPKYQAHIHDSWTPLLNELWNTCKLAWSYRMPENPADRSRLRQYCEQFLQFENETIDRYPNPKGSPDRP